MRKLLSAVVCLVLVPWLTFANNLLIGSNRGDGNSSTFDKYDDNGNFRAEVGSRAIYPSSNSNASPADATVRIRRIVGGEEE